LDGNVEKFKNVFSPIFSYADSLGVDVSFENCQMEGWMQQGQRDALCNLAATRQLRGMMVDAVKASNIKFIVDPSHDLCQGIPASEVVEGLKYETPERTRALHIKDTDTNFPAAVQIRAMRGGFAQPASKRAHEWDIYGAMPTLIGFAGGGDLDWTEYIRAGVKLLQNSDGSYKPVIVENEDIWSKQTGNRAATWQANQAVYLNLAPLCYQLTDKGYQYNYSKYSPMIVGEVKMDKVLDTYTKVKQK